MHRYGELHNIWFCVRRKNVFSQPPNYAFGVLFGLASQALSEIERKLKHYGKLCYFKNVYVIIKTRFDDLIKTRTNKHNSKFSLKITTAYDAAGVLSLFSCRLLQVYRPLTEIFVGGTKTGIRAGPPTFPGPPSYIWYFHQNAAKFPKNTYFGVTLVLSLKKKKKIKKKGLHFFGAPFMLLRGTNFSPFSYFFSVLGCFC